MWGTYRVSFTLKGEKTTQSFVDLEEAIIYRNALVVPKIKKTRDRKAYMAIYNQTYKRKPRFGGSKYSDKGVYQAGPAEVALTEFSTDKPKGKSVPPEDKRRTKGGWSKKPIVTSGPVLITWA
jgi:hypothetical protein